MYLNQQQRENLKLSSLHLAIGENSRTIQCPECNQDGDFSVTRYANGLFYICYRASCGARGFVGSNSGVQVQSTPKKAFVPFTYETEGLRQVDYNYFMTNFDIMSTELQKHGVRWCPTMSRMIFPCFDIKGMIWGYNARYYPSLDLRKNHGPVGGKSIIYPDKEDYCKVSWSRGVDTKIVVLVEDQVSAIRLSEDVTTVALLGHEVPECLMENLADRDVVIALDQDVTAKVGNLLLSNALKVRSIRAIPLVEDVKNMKYASYNLFLDRVFQR